MRDITNSIAGSQDLEGPTFYWICELHYGLWASTTLSYFVCMGFDYVNSKTSANKPFFWSFPWLAHCIRTFL